MKPIKQCVTCPWRVDADVNDIPNYDRELHEGLDDTITKQGEELSGMLCPTMRIMACHYSKPGEEFPCAGWLHNQLGPGNNIALRLRVAMGQIPPPEVDGDQHERFEDTLCEDA